MKKRIFATFFCVALLICMFAFSFSVNASMSGVYYRRWVDSTNAGTLTYWHSWISHDVNDGTIMQSWCPGNRFYSDEGDGYVYSIYRQNNTKFKKFLATVDFGRPETIDDWLHTIRMEPGTKTTVILRGYLEGNFDWSNTWYQVYGLFRYQGEEGWLEPVPVSLMQDGNGNFVSHGHNLVRISDTKASFYIHLTFNNNTDMDAALQGFYLYFDHPDMQYYTMTIYDVEFKHFSSSIDVEQEFGSVDNSTDETIAISGAFSFLNKPLNNILNAFRSIGSFVWSRTPSFLQNALNSVYDFAISFWSSFTSSIRQFVSDPLGSLSDIAENIRTGISQTAYNIWNGAPSWLRNPLSNIATTISNVYDSIISFFEKLIFVVTNTSKAVLSAVAFVFSAVSSSVAFTGYLPSVIGGCFLTVIALSILKLLLSM